MLKIRGLMIMTFFSLLVLSTANPYSFNLYDDNLAPQSTIINSSSFLNLTDTPDNYTGFSNNCLKVNSSESGIYFGSCATGGSGLTATNPPYLSDDGITIFFNETKLNESIKTKGDELYYPLSNPSGYITGVDLTNYSLTNETNTFLENQQFNKNIISNGSVLVQDLSGNYINLSISDVGFKLAGIKCKSQTGSICTVFGGLFVTPNENSNVGALVLLNNSGSHQVKINPIYSSGNVIVSSPTGNMNNWVWQVKNNFTSETFFENNVLGNGFNATFDYFKGNGIKLTDWSNVTINSNQINNPQTLNVNSSDYWDNLNNTNTTQFENNAGTLSIISSWLTSFLDSWFSIQTTDTLTQGSNNLYDNRSWNESHADSKYYLQTNPSGYISSYTETDPIYSSENNTISRNGNCPAGQVVQNTTSSGVQCTTVSSGSSGNAFDQSLNTTENVTFAGLNITGESLFSGASTFDGDVIFNGEISGTKSIFTAGSTSAYTLSAGATQFLKGAQNGLLFNSADGWITLHDGSITSLSYKATQTHNSGVGNDKLCYEVMVNNVNVFNSCSTDSAIPSIGYSAGTRTQARNIDTFLAGDMIQMRIRNVGDTTMDVDDIWEAVEVIYDN